MVLKFQVNQIKIEDFRKFGPNWTTLTFWPMFSSKLVGGWIQWPDMQMLIEFQVNWIKIKDFRNLAHVDLVAYVYLKINKWLSSATSYANGFQISSESDEIWRFQKIRLKLAYWPM